MNNTVINTFSDRDDELFNVVIARGAGSGINRIQVTVRDAVSVAEYGERIVVVDFPAAVNLTDLTTKANEYLEDKKNPVQHIDITHYYNHDDPPSFERGDTIRVADTSLGFAVTSEIQELDWSFDKVNLSLGAPFYSLIDELINKPEEEEREKKALGLPVPVGLKAQKAAPGIVVLLNAYSNSRAVGVEIYASTTTGFTPSNATLLSKAPGTRFEFRDAVSGAIYYFKARSYDGSGEVSDFTEEVNAQAGYVDGSQIGPGTITDITPFASDLRPVRIVTTLPTVISTDPDWIVGDIVFFDGDLYRLISKTGDPNTDWDASVVTNATDIIGQITETQIADDSIKTYHMVANTIDGSVITGDSLNGDKIVGNSITAGQIQAGAIRAEELAVNAVTAKHMTIADFKNLVINPWKDNQQGFDGWGGFPVGSSVSQASQTPEVDWYAYYPTTGSTYLTSNSFPVSPGEKFRVRLATTLGGTASDVGISFGMRWGGPGGAFISSSLIGVATSNTSSATLLNTWGNWKYWSFEVTAPVNAIYGSFRMESLGGTTGGWSVSKPEITRLSEGSLIVDGAITANKIVAGDITSREISNLGANVMVDSSGVTIQDASSVEQLKFGNITGKPGVPVGTDFGLWGAMNDGIYISDIDTNNIKAGAITTEKLTTGVIELTNSFGRTGYMTIKDGLSNDEVMRIGNIGGIPQIPSGTYGLWGTLGAGIFIEGAPKLIQVGTTTAVGESSWQSGFPVGGNASITCHTPYFLTDIQIPTGKVWHIIPVITEQIMATSRAAINEINIYRVSDSAPNSNIGSMTLPDTTSGSIKLHVNVRMIYVVSSANEGIPEFTISYTVIEVDA